MPFYPGTDVPANNDPAIGYDPNVFPGVMPQLPVVAEPGITMTDARAGASPTFDSKSSGGDVATWDNFMQLLTLGGNIYAASRTQPGSVPGTPDQTGNKTRPTVTPEAGNLSAPAIPTSKVSWPLIILFLVAALFVAWLIFR